MSPPSALHRSGVRTLSPGFKVFLSGSVLLLGGVGTLPFYQPGQVLRSFPPTDDQPVIVALPDGIAELPPLVKTKESLPIVLPSVAVQMEKYAQAYPEPNLVPKSLPPPKVSKPSEPVGHSVAKPAVTPITPIRTFASIHQLAPKTTAPFDRQATAFDEQPECIDPQKIVDSLLPLFHFAENLKPSSQEASEKTPPENPFRQPDEKEERKLSPLRPYVELRPLRLPKEKVGDGAKL